MARKRSFVLLAGAVGALLVVGTVHVVRSEHAAAAQPATTRATTPTRAGSVPALASAEAMPTVREQESRDEIAKRIDDEMAAAWVPADPYPDPVVAGKTEDASAQLIESVRPCVQAAATRPGRDWTATFRYEAVIENGKGHVEQLEVLDTEMSDPALLTCMKNTLAQATFKSIGDLRTSVELTVPIGRLLEPR